MWSARARGSRRCGCCTEAASISISCSSSSKSSSNIADIGGGQRGFADGTGASLELSSESESSSTVCATRPRDTVVKPRATGPGLMLRIPMRNTSESFAFACNAASLAMPNAKPSSLLVQPSHSRHEFFHSYVTSGPKKWRKHRHRMNQMTTHCGRGTRWTMQRNRLPSESY